MRARVGARTARRIALVAPTAADARDVMVEGESGLLAIAPPWDRPRLRAVEAAADLAQRRDRDDLFAPTSRSGCAGRSTISPGATSSPRGAIRRPGTC